MSRIIATAAIRGAHYYMSQAETHLGKAIEEHGADAPVGFPNTAYFLPLILALYGKKVETLKREGRYCQLEPNSTPEWPLSGSQAP